MQSDFLFLDPFNDLCRLGALWVIFIPCQVATLQYFVDNIAVVFLHELSIYSPLNLDLRILIAILVAYLSVFEDRSFPVSAEITFITLFQMVIVFDQSNITLIIVYLLDVVNMDMDIFSAILVQVDDVERIVTVTFYHTE